MTRGTPATGRRRDVLSLEEARALAVAAQGLDGRLRGGSRDGVRRALRLVGALQLDGVNVIARAQYLALFARLGAYQMARLDDLATHRGRAFEYWGHEASVLPVEDQPLFRWRMEEVERGEWRRGLGRFARAHPTYVRDVLDEVTARGPLAAGDLEDRGHDPGTPWWGWSDGKRALEWLFATGRVMAVRGSGFERRYDLAERVLPAKVLAMATPEPTDAHRALVERAVRALGVGTPADIADYYRLKVSITKAAIRSALEAGTIEEVRVEGWHSPAYRPTGARIPRPRPHTALLSPFDSLVWNRDRTLRLFGFNYRIEIYTPAPQREFGYYVLPIVHDGRLVGRLDVKAERPSESLLVHGAYVEPGVIPAEVAEPVAAELLAMADWLGLAWVRTGRRGDLADPIRSALGGSDA